MPNARGALPKLARAVLASLRAHGEPLGRGPLVLAVSGGADSLALLFSTASLSPHSRPELIVAHFSHGLRPTAEKREASLVRKAAAACGLVVMQGHAVSGPSESDARNARYAFFADVARAAGAHVVATAHTQDDQAETVLLRLTRGAGSRGAAAMAELAPWPVAGTSSDATPLVLLRPLLAMPRSLTEAACVEAGVRPARDGSNRRLRFARNRVRLRVLPELERINPNVRELLAGFAASARDDDDLLAAVAADAVGASEVRSDDEVSWPRPVLAGLPSPLFARVVQGAYRHVRGEAAALSRARILAMGKLASQSHGGELAIGSGVRFVVEQDACRITMLPALVPKPEIVSLAVPGVTDFGGWVLTAELVAPPSDVVTGPLHAWLDADELNGALCVRTAERGDRFQPLGMGERARLQEVLLNAKIPRGSRATLPLVVSARGIAWVPGVRIAHWARVTPGTRRVLGLTAQPPPRLG
jgi:tRNA(Ile)-lysidine synthase